MNILEIEGLVKTFGKNEVINGLSMKVPEHSVFGFVGGNGAGKTTTMKMVLGLLKPTAGEIRVCEERVAYGETGTNRHVGYLPDVPEFYGYMRPMEYLRLCGRITGLSPRQTRQRGKELLTLVGLAGANKRIGGFSRGMKQRLGIAQALLNEPRLLICDEPTSALDPVGRREILEILRAVSGKTTVLFSTHILSDVERICDRVAVLNRGKLALCGTLAEMKARRRQDGFLIAFAGGAQAAAFQGALQAMGAPILGTSLEDATLTVTVSDTQSGGALLLTRLAGAGLVPARFEALEPTLESLFLEAVQ